LAQLIVNSGGVAAVVDYVSESQGSARVPGVMTLGYIAAFSETLALSVIVAKGVAPVAKALTEETEEGMKAACAWTLGQIGRHSPDHAKTLTSLGVLPKLLHVLESIQDDTSETSADLKTKTQRALKSILEKTLDLESLEPLLQNTTPTNILKYVVGQFAKMLPHDVQARRAFVTSGCLQRLQSIASSYNTESAASGVPSALTGTKLGESIRAIHECYPEEIVRYFSPGYSTTLLEKVLFFHVD
jgi:hypothetical protein